MADIRDEHGRPIQLTDDHGRPVQLTDEHGVPMHLTGVATTAGETPHGRTTIGSELHDTPAATNTMMGSETHSGTHFAPKPVDYAKRGTEAVAGAGAATVGVAAGVGKAVTASVTGGGAPVSHTQAHDAGVDTKQVERSTSLSSEEDGEEGRKKKGLMQKIKEKLPGHNDKHAAAHSINTKPTTTAGAPATAPVTVMEEHEKKGFMDKIKDKLPGHHSS